MKRNIHILLSALLLWYGLGFMGSFFTAQTVDSAWYHAIKPVLTPPTYIFPLVWLILYGLIACSFWLAWNHAKQQHRKKLLLWFGINLLANATWTLFYFGLQSPLAGLLDITLIDLSCLAMIHYTTKVSPKAAYLLYPYAVWLAFATILNVLSL